MTTHSPRPIAVGDRVRTLANHVEDQRAGVVIRIGDQTPHPSYGEPYSVGVRLDDDDRYLSGSTLGYRLSELELIDDPHTSSAHLTEDPADSIATPCATSATPDPATPDADPAPEAGAASAHDAAPTSDPAVSDEDHAGIVVDPVGSWVERSVVHERHELSRRYPESLVPVTRVRLRGFTIALDLELPSKPEAAARGRRVLEQVCDAIERVVRGRDANPVAQADVAHGSSPLGSADAGATAQRAEASVPLRRDTDTVGDLADTVATPCATSATPDTATPDADPAPEAGAASAHDAAPAPDLVGFLAHIGIKTLPWQRRWIEAVFSSAPTGFAASMAADVAVVVGEVKNHHGTSLREDVDRLDAKIGAAMAAADRVVPTRVKHDATRAGHIDFTRLVLVPAAEPGARPSAEARGGVRDDVVSPQEEGQQEAVRRADDGVRDDLPPVAEVGEQVRHRREVDVECLDVADGRDVVQGQVPQDQFEIVHRASPSGRVEAPESPRLVTTVGDGSDADTSLPTVGGRAVPPVPAPADTTGASSVHDAAPVTDLTTLQDADDRLAQVRAEIDWLTALEYELATIVTDGLRHVLDLKTDLTWCVEPPAGSAS